MRTGIAALLALVLVAFATPPLKAQFRGPRGEDPEAAKHGWMFRLEEGKAQARKNGKPLMVVVRCVP